MGRRKSRIGEQTAPNSKRRNEKPLETEHHWAKSKQLYGDYEYCFLKRKKDSARSAESWLRFELVLGHEASICVTSGRYFALLGRTCEVD